MTARTFSTALWMVAFPLGAARAETPSPAGEGTRPRKLGAVVTLNLSQSAFSDNWSGGDRGSLRWVLNADLSAEQRLGRSVHWSNALQLAYGQTAQQVLREDGGRGWAAADKTTDLVLFESVARFAAGSLADPYVSFRLDTQFLDESDPLGEILFNPVKFTETGGVARVILDTEETDLLTRIGFGFRQSLARSFAGAGGAGTKAFTTSDGGFEWQSEGSWKLLGGKVLEKSKLLVFFPLFYSRAEALERFDEIARAQDPDRERVAGFWKAPDVNFQSTLSAEITEWLSVNLYVQLFYDKFDAATNVDTSLELPELAREVEGGIRKSGQFKETLAVAVSYRFL